MRVWRPVPFPETGLHPFALCSNPFFKAAPCTRRSFSARTRVIPMAARRGLLEPPVGPSRAGGSNKKPRVLSGAGSQFFRFLYATVSPRPGRPHTVARSISAGFDCFVRRYVPKCGRSSDKLGTHRDIGDCGRLRLVRRRLTEGFSPSRFLLHEHRSPENVRCQEEKHARLNATSGPRRLATGTAMEGKASSATEKAAAWQCNWEACKTRQGRERSPARTLSVAQARQEDQMA